MRCHATYNGRTEGRLKVESTEPSGGLDVERRKKEMSRVPPRMKA